MGSKLAAIDYVVLTAYLLGTLALGLWIGRRVRTQSDYFLAGRRLPWWAIGLSLVATDIGGTDIIGVGGAAYSYGLAVGNFEWIGCVPAMIVAAFVFVPFFWRIGIYTIPEYMERRYNVGMRLALAGCWLVFMACNLGVMLLASAKMMSVLFGWDTAVCIWVTAAFVGLYTVAGGLAAVVYTDALQCTVMILGCLLVVVLGLADVGGLRGLHERVLLHQQRLAAVSAQEAAERSASSSTVSDDAPADGAHAPADLTDSAGPAHAERARPAAPTHADSAPTDAAHAAKPSQTQPALTADAAHPTDHISLVLPVDTDSPFPWTGILLGLAFVLSPAYWIGNQAIVQRSLGAKSEFEAKAAYVWGAVLKNLIPFLIAVPGLIAFARYSSLPDGDQAFPRLVADLLPVGCRGVFLAAFLAALMSSVDSYLNSASVIVTSDFYRRLARPEAADRHLLLVGRLVTVGLVFWAVWFAFFLTGRSEGIYTIFQTLMSFFQGPALAVLLLGLLWRRANGRAALTGFLLGLGCSVGLFTLSQPAVYHALGWRPLFQIDEPFLYYSVWAFLVTLSVTVAVSWLTRPEGDEKLKYLVYAAKKQAQQ